MSLCKGAFEKVDKLVLEDDWDENGTTIGFGTASGTWADPTLNLWNTSNSGRNGLQASRTTTTGDNARFGWNNRGLASGTISLRQL